MFHLRIRSSPIIAAIMSKSIITGLQTKEKRANNNIAVESLECIVGVIKQPKAVIRKKAENIPFEIVKYFATFSFKTFVLLIN